MSTETLPRPITDSIDGLDIDDLNELVAVMHFRPGMEMSVHQGYGSPCIMYHMRVPNSYHPDQEVDLFMHQLIPAFIRTVEDLYDFCLAIALWFDNHEGREWVRINGRPWRDPHTALGGVIDPFFAEVEFAKVKAWRPKPQKVTYANAGVAVAHWNW